ncbi:MAG: ATP-dependent DNA helicase RecG [Pseudomonadales bacterium]|jgi:ATP-dependent DNA helicase RecG|nr:ATP-dependent DNA helicase RecG [Pseudomonadales bacterium]
MTDAAPADEQLPLTLLKGVGPQLAAKLAQLGISTILDLLFHLPLRYQDRTRLTPIAALRQGDDVVIEGMVAGCAVVQGRRRSLMVKVQDGSGVTTLRFFHFSAAQERALAVGARIRAYGEVRWGKAGVELYHPEYQLLQGSAPIALEDHLTPVYPATEGLQQTRLRKLLDQVFVYLDTQHALPELLPEELRQKMHFMPLMDALRVIHYPPPDLTPARLQSGEHPAQRRLVFEELLANYLSLRRLRDQARSQAAAPLQGDGSLRQALLRALPFPLTKAQRRVSEEISRDLSAAQPMLRLVQGDVGSGKTLVAVLAALQAVEAGYQAVLMAPTEILAEQHFLTLDAWLSPLGVELAFLSGRIKGKKRDAALEALRSGQARLIVGTHALFQNEVQFARLGLVIVDEQHRFGVHQRLSLREKGHSAGAWPHQLIMTATPIPRTLTMSAYADLDCSVIDELPPGRTPVNTVLLPAERRAAVVARIAAACALGRQAYWVCTLIEESEVLECQAAEATFADLCAALPALKLGLIHGRMKPREKAQVMSQFKNGELQLLVATTVIEVGVDVPNASLMIIENPERLGLAQLHQLRGRVGRGASESHCVLLYQNPLSGAGKERLSIMRESNDGFYIAQKDLEIRGPGEILGARQSGLAQLRIADLGRDSALQPAVRQWGEWIRAEHPALAAPLIRRWLAQTERYGNV